MKNIKTYKEYIYEEADYRNVTGNGTMGNPSDQNAGPSFNKGPYSATYRLPTIIGTETSDIEDPYFSYDMKKKKRVKKNPNIVKMRINKSKYLNKIEANIQNKKTIK